MADNTTAAPGRLAATARLRTAPQRTSTRSRRDPEESTRKKPRQFNQVGIRTEIIKSLKRQIATEEKETLRLKHQLASVSEGAVATVRANADEVKAKLAATHTATLEVREKIETADQRIEKLAGQDYDEVYTAFHKSESCRRELRRVQAEKHARLNAMQHADDNLCALLAEAYHQLRETNGSPLRAAPDPPDPAGLPRAPELEDTDWARMVRAISLRLRHNRRLQAKLDAACARQEALRKALTDREKRTHEAQKIGNLDADRCARMRNATRGLRAQISETRAQLVAVRTRHDELGEEMRRLAELRARIDMRRQLESPPAAAEFPDAASDRADEASSSSSSSSSNSSNEESEPALEEEGPRENAPVSAPASAPETPDAGDLETSEIPETPVAPEVPEMLEVPEMPMVSEVSDVPDTESSEDTAELLSSTGEMSSDVVYKRNDDKLFGSFIESAEPLAEVSAHSDSPSSSSTSGISVGSTLDELGSSIDPSESA